jgi:hypothetical protein
MRRVIFVLSALGFVLGTSGTLAQSPLTEQDRLLPELQAKPTDYEVNYSYVRASIDARDYEAAIVALERLLFFNPGLTRAKYELGVIYFRLHSYAIARRYFEEVLASPNLEPSIRRRIEIMLPAAAKELEPSRFYGVFQVGSRYSSNATQVPGSGLILAYSRSVLPLGPYYSAPDGNVFALGDVLHVYDFQNQRADTIETHFSGIATRQFRFGELSTMLGEISFGPRLAIAPELAPGATVRPYAIGGGSMLGGSSFNSGVGGGVSLRLPVGMFFSLEPGAEWRHTDARDSWTWGAQNTINTGSLWSASMAGRWSLTENLNVDVRGWYQRNPSWTNYLSSDQFGFDATVKIEFPPPSDEIGWKWSLTPFVRYADLRFDAANPFVDIFVARHDRQIRVGTQLDMPITPMFGGNALIQYTRNDSNIPNFRSTAWSALIGPTLRF